MIPSGSFDSIIVGGGFYGARLARMLRERGGRVLLVERESRLLGRASLRNQARVHNGYHYPRSILTSLRSRLNYARFLTEYADCVDESFTHYYAIATRLQGHGEPVRRVLPENRSAAERRAGKGRPQAVQLRRASSRCSRCASARSTP